MTREQALVKSQQAISATNPALAAGKNDDILRTVIVLDTLGLLSLADSVPASAPEKPPGSSPGQAAGAPAAQPPETTAQPIKPSSEADTAAYWATKRDRS